MIPHSKPTLGNDESDAAVRVIESGRIAQGTEVEAFEAECVEAVGRKYGVAVSSGTAALQLAIHALGWDDGQTVAYPSYACAALTTAVVNAGGIAALCDVSADYNLNMTDVPESAAGIIVPHLFGAPATIPDGTACIEDIAQSIGGDTGTTAPITIASFYATKLMTTGEGGMVLTDDEALAEFVRDRRDYDNRDTYARRFAFKMTDLQAAMGRVQLRRLPEFIDLRKGIAAHYSEAFAGLPIDLPHAGGHVFFRYVVGTDQRDDLEAHLHETGVDAKRPVHQPAHRYFNTKEQGETVHMRGDYSGSERAHARALSLPIYPTLSARDADVVIDAVRRFFDKGAAHV